MNEHNVFRIAIITALAISGVCLFFIATDPVCTDPNLTNEERVMICQ